MNSARRQSTGRHRSRGFTLLELLIVIGILTVLAVLTVISVGGIARDVKLSTGINRVMSALATARAEAIRTNRPVMLTFRVVKNNRKPGEPDRVEMVVARWTGELRNAMDFQYGSTSTPRFAERFELAPEIPPLLLPDGIKVAGPYSDFTHSSQQENPEEIWCCMSSGPWVPRDTDSDGKIDYYHSEVRGEMLGILFASDGSVQTRSTASMSSGLASTYRWVDFDGNDWLDRYEIPDGVSNNSSFYMQNDTLDEPFVNMVQFLVVYDEKRAQEEVDFGMWNSSQNLFTYIDVRDDFLGAWIDENADRIHFNRYTGLAELAN